MGQAEGLAHHECLASVEIHGGFVEAERRVAGKTVFEIADERVDLARLEDREALLRREADELDLGRRPEDRIGDGPAQGNVETLPLAGTVLEGIAGNAGIYAADELAALLHGIEGWAVHLSLCRVQSYSDGPDGQ